MSYLSSINFKKSNDFQVFHNSTVRPTYALGGSLEYNIKGYAAKREKEKIIDEAKQAYASTCKAKNKAFQAKNYEWSAVVNIKPETTMQDLEKLAKHFSDKYKFQCYQIAIHRDEGHINEQGEKVINHHAHLEFITLDKETGKQIFKMRDFTPQKMREIQSEVAEILGMTRGQDKRLSGAKRIEPRQYAQMKEQERANTRALKAELDNTKQELTQEHSNIRALKAELDNTKQELAQEQETIKKLSASAIKKRLEQERKFYLNTNKALHEQGAQTIFTAEHYKELRELAKNDFKSLDELEIALKELEKRIRKEQREREQRTSNKKQVCFKNKDFKSALIDEYYSDLSTKHDLSEFFFDKEHKSLKNKAKNYEIIDNNNSLTLINARTKDLKEQVALMIKMCESKKWNLDTLKITGSKAFCDEFKRQLQEKKEQELTQKNSIECNKEHTKITQKEPSQAEKILELEKELQKEFTKIANFSIIEYKYHLEYKQKIDKQYPQIAKLQAQIRQQEQEKKELSTQEQIKKTNNANIKYSFENQKQEKERGGFSR